MAYSKAQRERKAKMATQMQTQDVDQPKKEIPRYRLTEKCYLNDTLYDPENQPANPQYDPDTDPAWEAFKPIIIAWDKAPAYYMEPVNAAARERVKAQPPGGKMNVIDALTNLNKPQPQPA